MSLVLTDPQLFSSLFIREIGVSKAFCIKSNYDINHKGRVFEIEPGSLFITQESKCVGFCEPVLPPDIPGESCLRMILTQPDSGGMVESVPYYN